MVSPWDQEYLDTKRIKEGLRHLSDKDAKAAQWISETYGVSVINIVLDQPVGLSSPRIQVILDRQSDMPTFKDGFNFSAKRQREISAQLSTMGYPHTEAGLLVVFSSFESVALWDINNSVTRSDERDLLKRIGDPTLWTLHRCTSGTTFFFYTDADKDAAIRLGLLPRYSRAYCELLSKYDDFGYLDPNTYKVAFDSKETFKKVYGESWFNYDR